MTIRTAERITGLYLRRLENGKKWKYGLYELEADRVPLKTAEAYTAAQAISDLIEWHYKRVSLEVFQEQAWLCFACGRIPSQGLQADHIIPRRRGRIDQRFNLRGMCPADHRRRESGEILPVHPKVLEVVRKHGWNWTPLSEVRGWEKL